MENILLVILVALGTLGTLGTMEMLIINRDDENILKYLFGFVFLFVSILVIVLGAKL